MKDLNITSPRYDQNCSSDRQVMIRFVGGTQKNRLQTGYTRTVHIPYSSFSQRIREINRLGGKILDVAISGFDAAVSPIFETIVEEELVAENQVEVIETRAIAPEIAEAEKPITLGDDAPEIKTKPKKSRTSNKAASGFNKPKAAVKTTEPSKKPNSY